jgi:ubiquinone/menaquinone biosynthesis C-methylase UbiE
LGCVCGYVGYWQDGIRLLLPPGKPARYRDGEFFVQRVGVNWRSLLKDLGPKAFADYVVSQPPKVPSRTHPVIPGDLRRARRATEQMCAAGDATTEEPEEPIEWMVAWVGAIRPRRLLDIACGGGFFIANLLRSRATQGASIVAVDLDFLSLKTAQHHLRTFEEATVLGADVRCLPFPSESFDCITSNFGISHVIGFEHAVAEIARVLRPGGHLVACEVDFGHLFADLLNPLEGRQLASRLGLHGSIRSLTAQLRKAGFRIATRHRRQAAGFRWTEIVADRQWSTPMYST